MQPARISTVRPAPDEYAPYYGRYISLVGEGDIVAQLSHQIEDTAALLAGLSEEQAGAAYAPGKWTVKQVLGHIIDTERVFAYRALRVGRNDKTPLPGFDQDPFVDNAPFGGYSLPELLEEFEAVREASVLLLRRFDTEAWGRRGVVDGKPVTVGALAYVIAGHELHHRNVLRDKYLDGR